VTARLTGATVSDVVIQFRSVRMLIAQHQLDQVRHQVQRSDQAVIVASHDGRIFMTSEAVDGLIPRSHREGLERLDDLARLFTTPTAVQRRLRGLVKRNQTWRGEGELVGVNGEARPVLVRADPVFSAPGRVLGFVVVLADMLERKAADAARRRFQEKIVDGSRFVPSPLVSKADLLYKNLLSSVVENAQLAALEITDSVDARRMPELLESVQTSVDRSAELLRHLIRYAASVSKK
jgi:chemotaxis family two-component system sensor kinase Cph1